MLALIAAVALLAAASWLAACGAGTEASRTGSLAVKSKTPRERIIAAPRAVLGAAGPGADGTLWVVAGNSAVGLFTFSSATGRETGSVSVSRAARSVAQAPDGVVALAVSTRSTGALELMRGTDGKVWRTVSLPAPALQVIATSTSRDFYALTAWPSAASIAIVSSADGRIVGNVPVPNDAVSFAADPQQNLIYVLERNGLVDDIDMTAGSIRSSFSVGDPGESLALSPDGSTLYVLKGTTSVSNIAVIGTATESTVKVLPAPSHCIQVLVSPTGRQLYEVVGSPRYGNIQVVGL
jgi:hypothetical protein